MEYGELLVHRVDAAWAHDHEEDGKRSHLGGSAIGNSCMRAIWFSWLWSDREQFEGRMLRLFNRGHNQEEIFAELLRGVGATVWTADAKGNQFRVTAHGGHFGGAIDGVAVNLPDLPYGLPPNTPVLLEMKTHKGKLFQKLPSLGLIKAYPKHYKQAQAYMHLLGLKWCLYMAVNKDDDALWFHLFSYDETVATQLLNKAETIIFGQGMPPRISENASWWECKFCSMQGVCFKYKLADMNCRTCRYSHPERDGSWTCEKERPAIKMNPKLGCALHEYRPELC